MKWFLAFGIFVSLLFVSAPSSAEAACFRGNRPVLRTLQFVNPVRLIRVRRQNRGPIIGKVIRVLRPFKCSGGSCRS